MLELMPGHAADVDLLAVMVAASGKRKVELNRTERLLAAALIFAGGGRQADVVLRTDVSSSEASRLYARIVDTVGLVPRVA
jgi:hypothetical protein